MSNGYVKFTGDYSKLKDMGYNFQKLYAANYMQWEKNGFRIWKKGSEITHDEYDLFKLVTFLRTNPELKSRSYGQNGGTIRTFFKFYTDNSNRDYEFGAYDDANKKIYYDAMKAWSDVTDDTHRDDYPPMHTTIAITNDFLEQLRELMDLGWYELVEDHKD